MRFNGSCCYCSRILGIFLEYVDPWYVVPIKWLSMLLLANITFVLASFQEMFIGLFILVVYYRIRKNEKSSRLNTYILVVYYKMRENPLDSRFLPNFLKGKDLKRTKQIHYIFFHSLQSPASSRYVLRNQGCTWVQCIGNDSRLKLRECRIDHRTFLKHSFGWSSITYLVPWLSGPMTPLRYIKRESEMAFLFAFLITILF